MIQNLWNAAEAVISSNKREAHSKTGLSQEARKLSKTQPNIQLKELEKEQMKPKASRRREIIKIRAEINYIETNKQKKPHQLTYQ